MPENIYTVPHYGSGGGAAGPPGPAGPAGTTRYFLRYTHGGGVPAGGVQFLRLGVGVFSSEGGDLSTADATIRGISITVDAIDAAHTYDVNVLTDPAGIGGTGPTVVATLPLALSTRLFRDRAFAAAVAGLLDLGVEVRRTGGPLTASAFGEIVVLVEVSIP